jgi:formylglycine-generating enzyme required for sulfatase activity
LLRERAGAGWDVFPDLRERWQRPDWNRESDDHQQFRLDVYDVTVGRFRQFARAWHAGWRPTAGAGRHSHLNGGLGLVDQSGPVPIHESGWMMADAAQVDPSDGTLSSCNPYPPSTWTALPSTQERYPINCVTWWEAYAFCIWDGGFLPSEAEWEYAAAGGSEQREYPWGSTDPGTSNQYAIYACNYPSSSAACPAARSIANVAPVGTAALGLGRWGHADLAGLMWQYTLDWDHWPYGDPCVDCATLTSSDPTLGGRKQFRGGDFASPIQPPFAHNSDYPQLRSVGIGFRCARTP